jgi:putative copper export protein/methionine-rich copper-binding protein CopC
MYLLACMFVLVTGGMPRGAAAAAIHVDLVGTAIHVDLVGTVPERGAIVAAPPEVLLRFSGRIEHRYTSIAVTAPDGTPVPVGPVTFVADSDREFTAALSPVAQPGTYTVYWRTAGVDGHVLDGTFTFVLAGPEGPVAGAPAVPAAPDGVRDAAPDAARGAPHEHAEPGTSVAYATGWDAGAVAGRWLHFVALVLLLGGVAFRLLLLPRLGIAWDVTRDMQRRTWRFLAGAGLLLGVAAVLRLWLQSVALHGVELAWSSPLLTMMLAETSWGRAWVVQVFFLALLAIGILRARPGDDRAALIITTPAVLGLAAIPALTGHAAGMGGQAWLVVLNDALHVVAAGAWFGTLVLLLLVLPRALRRAGTASARTMADAVGRFSPVALGAAAVLVITGVINSLLHISTPRQLIDTEYGMALLVKLAVFAVVLAAGFYNWRVVRPRLEAGDDTRRLRISASLELGFVAAVLLVTAVLTGLPRP